MTKSWLVDAAFPRMETTYREMEGLLNENLYHPCPILKILDEGSAPIWKKKVGANQLEEYVEAEPTLTIRHKNIHSPFGIGRVTKAGRVDIQKLITSFSVFLEQHNQLCKVKFNFNQLIVNPKSVSYEDVTAQKIIFCEGSAASQNP